MLDNILKEDCCGCSACAQACPNSCINMILDEEGFWYPIIDKKKCINCKKCENVCPTKKNSINSNERKGAVYISYALDDGIRLQSSSGGMFRLIAEEAIKNSMIVYGAAFDSLFEVHHIAVDKIEDIRQLQGSKYIQSKIDDAYNDIKKNLKNGKKVLFAGTPCQVAGLKSFLQQDYEHLITIGILCHGVPSLKIWRKYIEEQKHNFKSEIQEISFRNKQNGWKSYSVYIKFCDGSVYNRFFADDLFMQLFLSNICLRPSCYNCHFKDVWNMADIVLGDCWGVENHSPEMDDNKGTSVVFVNSTKGENLWKPASSKMALKVTNFNEVFSETSEVIKSAWRHPNRRRLFKLIENRDLKQLKLLISISPIKRFLYKLIKIVFRNNNECGNDNI